MMELRKFLKSSGWWRGIQGLGKTPGLQMASRRSSVAYFMHKEAVIQRI